MSGLLDSVGLAEIPPDLRGAPAHRYSAYKQALLEEAERLVQAHLLREQEDIFYLTFQELRDGTRLFHDITPEHITLHRTRCSMPDSFARV